MGRSQEEEERECGQVGAAGPGAEGGGRWHSREANALGLEVECA